MRGASHRKTQRRETVPPPRFLWGRNRGHAWSPGPGRAGCLSTPRPCSPLRTSHPPGPHADPARAAHDEPIEAANAQAGPGGDLPRTLPRSPGGLSMPRPHKGRAPVGGHLDGARHKHGASVGSRAVTATASPAHVPFPESLRPGRVHRIFPNRTITLPSRKMKGGERTRQPLLQKGAGPGAERTARPALLLQSSARNAAPPLRSETGAEWVLRTSEGAFAAAVRNTASRQRWIDKDVPLKN